MFDADMRLDVHPQGSELVPKHGHRGSSSYMNHIPQTINMGKYVTMVRDQLK